MLSLPQTGILAQAAGCAALDAVAIARSALLTERYGARCGEAEYLALTALLLESAMRSGRVSLTLERDSLQQELHDLQQRELRYGQPSAVAKDFFSQAEKLLEHLEPQAVFSAQACQGTAGMFSALRPGAELIAADGCLHHRRYYDYELQIRRYLAGVREAGEGGGLLLSAEELTQAARLCAALHGQRQSRSEKRGMPDLQRAAAAMALLRPLTVITGGPGTGKTHTVFNILLLLRILYGPEHRIALAAPTGKAAARLRELLTMQLAQLGRERGQGRGGAAARAAGLQWPELAEQIAADAGQARTLHRLLGAVPYLVSPVRAAGADLQAETLIVDEASMIDISLFCRLLARLRPGMRLILLGDRHQLGPVEPGAALRLVTRQDSPALTPQLCTALKTLCGSTDTQVQDEAVRGGITGCGVHLRHNYRSRGAPGLVSLADGLRQRQDVETLQQIIAEHADELELRSWPAGEDESAIAADAVQQLLDEALEGKRGYAGLFDCLQGLARPFVIDADSDAEPLWGLLDGYRLLCANRTGPLGAAAVNAALDAAVVRKFSGRGGFMHRHGFYPGRIVMLTRNDPDLGLSNGDVGFMARDGRDGERLKLFLRTADGTAGRVRRLGTIYLEGCEPAYALSVHKAQGSEYQHVSVVLPLSYNSVLSAGLLYTAVTRARERVIIHGSMDLIGQALRADLGSD